MEFDKRAGRVGPDRINVSELCWRAGYLDGHWRPEGEKFFFLRYFAFLKFNFFVVARNYNLRKPRSELLCSFQREKGKNVLKVILNLVWRGTFETIEVHCAFGGKNDFILCVCVLR